MKKESNPPPPEGAVRPPAPLGPPRVKQEDIEREELMDFKVIQTAINPTTGLTELEQRCMDGLMIAYASWLKLERQHPDEMRGFVDAIHRIQDLLAVRVIRRHYPNGWPTHKVKPPITPEASDGMRKPGGAG